jgi:hypothetical protein
VKSTTEEKKGRVKITIEIEFNEALMEMAKESMAKMPEMMSKFRKKEPMA